MYLKLNVINPYIINYKVMDLKMYLKKCIILFLVMSSCFLCVNCQKNEIQNITINPIMFPQHSTELVQLNISWISILPKSTMYDVSLVTARNNTKMHCSDTVCVRINLNTTHIVVPNDIITHHNQECIFHLDCDYIVVVEDLNKHVSRQILYHVNECIGSKCRCVEHDVPESRFSVHMVERNASVLKVEYVVSKNKVAKHEPKKVMFSVQNKARDHDWKLQLFSEELVFNSYGGATSVTELVLDSPMAPNESYMIKSYVIDSNDCKGKSKEFLLETPMKHVQQNEIHTWLILLIVISCSMTLLITSLVTMYFIIRCRKHRNYIHKWRGICNNTDSTSGMHLQIPMQENALYYLNQPFLDASAQGEVDALEIPHTALKVGPEIGKGAFGRVFYGIAIGIPGKVSPCTVAIKQLKRKPTTDELEEFTGEITTMKKVGRHPNVVSLLGFCTIKQPLLMVMEFVGCGDLLKYLHKVREKRDCKANKEMATQEFVHVQQQSRRNSKLSMIKFSNSNWSIQRPYLPYADLQHQNTGDSVSYISQPDPFPTIIVTQPSTESTTSQEMSSLLSKTNQSIEYVLDHKELHHFAIQIARGMKHLEEKQITHRDLAARNILIDENKTLKISDFGLSRMGIYVNTKMKQVPLRWLSIEAIRDSLYSSKSDVWAFGVLLWEIGTLGAFPYTSVANTELLSYLLSGKRLERPENISHELYELMLSCWTESPSSRPTFQQITTRLEPHKQHIYIDFDEIDPNYTFPPTRDQINPHVNTGDIATSTETNNICING